MFNAIYFVYDGVYSGDYDLKIATIDGDNIETTSVFSPTLTLAKGAKSKRFFYSGIDYEDSPQYQFSILSDKPISAARRREVLSWLVGRHEFKKLYVHQPEYDDIYFNCIFNVVDLIYVNGNCHGFQLTAKFDSIYCYGKPTVCTVNLGSTETSATVSILNKSDVLDDYVYPKVEIAGITGGTGNISIKNETDGARTTKYNAVQSTEKVVIDNELKIIDSNLGGNKLGNFNLNWLRLKKGENQLKITGKGTVTITCPQYIMLGF